MFFVCEPESKFVDYLDPEAVKRWMTLTYDQFDQTLRPAFRHHHHPVVLR